MAPFPLPLADLLSKWGIYLIYFLIGASFGAVLEMAGFGNSRKLSAQFYFRDATVLKVMFTGIITAMVLVFWASGINLLDYNLVWVNPTYLWPGIVGGLIMGFGFIIGGFCPGTSLVAAATLKIDGVFFALGTFFGIFLFGETVPWFDDFWHSSYMGRFTLMDWLNLSTGVVVLLAVAMALFMFWGSEQLERIIGKQEPAKAPRWRFGAAGVFMLASVGLVVMGQPTTAERWANIASEKEAALTAREVQIHPAELLDLLANPNLIVVMLDVRRESEYNLFHLRDAQNVPLAEVPALIPTLHFEAENTLFVTMSNDEAAATEAWKILVAEAVPNVYILEGGINHWLTLFAGDSLAGTPTPIVPASLPDTLRYTFTAALGESYPFAAPNPEAYELEYTPKVQLKIKRGATGGGCG